MWFFDWFEDYFGTVRDWFEDTADDIRWVPVLGEYLAYPFDWIGWAFANLETAAAYASDWADDVYSSAWDVFWDVKGYIENEWSILTKSAWDRFWDIKTYIEDEWSILTKSARDRFWDIKAYAESTWSILTKSTRDIFNDIQSYAESTWSILTKTSGDIFSDIKGYAESTWSILLESKDSIWTYLENYKLGAWFDTQILKAKTTILGFVTVELGYLTTEWFKFLEASWASVQDSFAWLTGKLLEIVDEEIDAFKDRIWNIIERFVEKF